MTWQPDFSTTFGYGVQSLSALVYGPSGAGKTTLAGTTGDPERTLILAAEPGLLPLRHLNIRVVEIDTQDKLRKVLMWLEGWAASGTMGGWWVVLDSISEIAERVLVDLKAKEKDPRKAYGEVQDVMMDAMKRVRSLPCHTVIIAKQDRLETDTGLVYGPSMPGKKLGPRAGYEFDLVFALRVARDPEGRIVRWLQTQPDAQYDAKDRSGVLDEAEPCDLAYIASKILGASAPMEVPQT
jgi:hypothetical protein